MDGLLESLGISRRNDVVAVVEQVAFAVALEDSPKVPTMPVIIGELGVVKLWVELADFSAEFRIGPFATHYRAFGIALERRAHFAVVGIFLLFWPHRRRGGPLVPHRVAEHAVQEQVRLVHVAYHALARRDRRRHPVLQ